MVKQKAFLPSKDSIAWLAQLSTPVSVLRQRESVAAPPVTLVLSSNENAVRVSASYNDVVFKFECFRLEIDLVPPESWQNMEEVDRFEGGLAIKCLFRFEWERPACLGELPSHWEQVVRSRGKRQDISEKATALCVSMVGLVFGDIGQEGAAISIVCDDDTPATLRICREPEDLRVLIDECECVELNDVHKWKEELRTYFLVGDSGGYIQTELLGGKNKC
jgi:hypothetical protein